MIRIMTRKKMTFKFGFGFGFGFGFLEPVFYIIFKKIELLFGLFFSCINYLN
jgi:hypothetical protein